MKRKIVWHGGDGNGAEYCVLGSQPGGYRLEGTMVGSMEGAPLLVTYAVKADINWVTRRVEIHVDGGGGKASLILLADGYGSWWREKRQLHHLEGCLDVDLGCSPSTNTLALRRLKLRQAQTAEIAAAWVKVPELLVERSRQSYERLDANAYRFRSGSFEGDLIVDDDGLVVDYAAWTAAAKA